MPTAPKRRPPFIPDPLWPRVVQAFVGLFFVAAAYFKLTDSFFGARMVPLADDIQYWMDAGFMLKGYDAFMRLLLPYADFLASVVILFQMAVGILLVYNKKLRWAAAMLFFLQMNILLSTINGFGFLTFSGVALWLAAYYFFRERMTPRTWAVLTWILVIIGAKYQEQRFLAGDAWLSTFPLHYAHFQQDIMSIHPVLKQWVMHAADANLQLAAWVDIGLWWMMIPVLFLMISPLRLYAGFAWMLLWLMRSLVWTTGVTGEGTLFVLVYFTWVVQEEYMQQGAKPGWLLPKPATLAGWWRRLTGAKKGR